MLFPKATSLAVVGHSVCCAGLLLGIIGYPTRDAIGQSSGDSTGEGRKAGNVTVAADHAKKMERGRRLFQDHVRGVLVRECLPCHGGKKTEGDFSLAARDVLLESGAVDLDDPHESYMLALMRHEESPHMPHERPKLKRQDIERVQEWIALGAPFDRPLSRRAVPAPKKAIPNITDAERDYWAFRPLTRVEPPRLDRDGWSRTAIDRFISARLREVAIEPNRMADRRTLIRRAYFDLLGLPPSPESVDRFVADPDPLAYEKLIDRLLQSPHYGERWARHWIDVARFAESHGYEQDYDRPTAYHYRDFLIRALNADLPYDTFVRWQIAGDELAPDNPMAWAATGFLGACAFPTQLTEAEFESARYNELDDFVSTLGGAFLGLTLGCARCHDHKYDPVSQYDYYRLAASFNFAIRSEKKLDVDGTGKPVAVLVTSEGLKPLKHHADGRGFPHFYPQTYQLNRGDVKQKKGVAQPGFLRVLMRDGKQADFWKRDAPTGSTSHFLRASVADWITDTQYGAGALAARVAVNRVWHYHFGRGLVATPNDFGKQGGAPSHPGLLEYLADDFVRSGWQLKRLHRLIMTSAVYMQSSAFDEARAKIDRENRWRWRFEPRRLEAEVIRDTILSVSERLDETLYGPGSLDVRRPRRSVYLFIKRSKLVPMMMLFDWPEHLVSIGRRASTTTAPQALFLMNHPMVIDSAQSMAAHLPHDIDAFVDEAYRRVYQRRASAGEHEAAVRFVTGQQALYQRQGQAGPAASKQARTDWCQALLSSHEALFLE